MMGYPRSLSSFLSASCLKSSFPLFKLVPWKSTRLSSTWNFLFIFWKHPTLCKSPSLYKALGDSLNCQCIARNHSEKSHRAPWVFFLIFHLYRLGRDWEWHDDWGRTNNLQTFWAYNLSFLNYGFSVVSFIFNLWCLFLLSFGFHLSIPRQPSKVTTPPSWGGHVGRKGNNNRELGSKLTRSSLVKCYLRLYLLMGLEKWRVLVPAAVQSSRDQGGHWWFSLTFRCTSYEGLSVTAKIKKIRLCHNWATGNSDH